jgi:hypothetical protein
LNLTDEDKDSEHKLVNEKKPIQQPQMKMLDISTVKLRETDKTHPNKPRSSQTTNHPMWMDELSKKQASRNLMVEKEEVKVKKLGDEKKNKSKPMIETDKNEASNATAYNIGCGAVISESIEVDAQPDNRDMSEVRMLQAIASHGMANNEYCRWQIFMCC